MRYEIYKFYMGEDPPRWRARSLAHRLLCPGMPAPLAAAVSLTLPGKTPGRTSRLEAMFGTVQCMGNGITRSAARTWQRAGLCADWDRSIDARYVGTVGAFGLSALLICDSAGKYNTRIPRLL